MAASLSASGWATLLAILASFLLLLCKAFGLRNRKLNLPPGPKPWPIIGNLNLMGALPHQSIHELSKKYGELMYIRFGSAPVLVGSSAEMAKEILFRQDVSFISRPQTAAGKHTAYNYSNITWAPYGEHWRQARKMCWTELFSARRLASYEDIRRDEIHALLGYLFQSSGIVVSLRDHLANMTLNVISRMVLGRKYIDDSEGKSIVTPGEFKEMLDELFFLGGALNIGDAIPWLDFLDLQSYVKRMKQLSKKIDLFLEHVIDEHDERRTLEGNEFVAKDMVDVLLQFVDGEDLKVKFDRNNVKAFTLDLIAGGTESSAVTVEWAMSELLKQPHILEKAAKEIERVIGKERWVDEKEVHNLPYVEAIMKETMRLHPVAPFLAPRMSREDTKINGYDIPEGTRVFVNVWTIGRDASLWENPYEFKPERFMGREIDVKGTSYELLPFGAGRRMCPGYSLGLKVIQAGLANLIHGFKWSLPYGMRPEDLNMEETFGLTTPRKLPCRQLLSHAFLPIYMLYEYDI